MDGLRSVTWFFAVVLGIAVVVFGSRTFLADRTLPDSPSLDQTTAARSLSARGGTASASGLDENRLVDERIDRLQSVIRRQKKELTALRAKRPAPRSNARAEVKGKTAAKTPGLLDRLPKLSAIVGAGDTDTLSKEELTSQLVDLRDVALNLRDQLEAAESVVEMQSSEIENLQEEIDSARERVAALAEESEGLDAAVEEMLDEARDIERIARTVLVDLGPTAAAVLLTMSDDDRAHIRTWVRDVLGAIAETDPERSGEP